MFISIGFQCGFNVLARNDRRWAASFAAIPRKHRRSSSVIPNYRIADGAGTPCWSERDMDHARIIALTEISVLFRGPNFR